MLLGMPDMAVLLSAMRCVSIAYSVQSMRRDRFARAPASQMQHLLRSVHSRRHQLFPSPRLHCWSDLAVHCWTCWARLREVRFLFHFQARLPRESSSARSRITRSCCDVKWVNANMRRVNATGIPAFWTRPSCLWSRIPLVCRRADGRLGSGVPRARGLVGCCILSSITISAVGLEPGRSHDPRSDFLQHIAKRPHSPDLDLIRQSLRRAADACGAGACVAGHPCSSHQSLGRLWCASACPLLRRIWIK